ncbi:DUF222 domain-containing protein, partial [Parafrankia sp. BMG5.11]|uniref:HNH endonuclease n=1 Tax=Parafrankia sp. BMG5.11 TaxID=222540 RepID=UPI0035A10BE8
PDIGLIPGLDAQTAPLADLEAAICGWAGRLAAATCGWLVLLSAFERRGGWSGIGLRSCAHWLSWRCGIGLRAAREHLATARALEQLPKVRAAFADGTISYSKVRAITRIADPTTEPLWLEHALHCTAGQLERLVRTLRQTTADPNDRARTQAARRVSWRTDDNGMLHLTAVLPPDEGAHLITALDAARASLDTTTTDAGTDAGQSPPDGEIVAAPRDRRRDADALLALAEGFLQQPAPGLTSPAHTITVHIDATTLLDTTQPHPPQPRPRPGSRAEISPATGLSPTVLRRLGRDGLIRTLLTDTHGNPLRLGRRRRLPNRQLRDAVHARDRGTCQYPGCAHTRRLHTHHLIPWVEGGGTDIDNLTLVCGEHHRTLHDENIKLRRTTAGRIIALLPDGRTLDPAPPANPGARPAEVLAEATRHVAPDAIITRNGGPFHLDDSIRALLRDHAA